jgi:glycogen debranching enzyme
MSDASGQIVPGGAQGCFVGDLRVVSAAVVTVDGGRPLPLGTHRTGPSGIRYVAAPNGIGASPDPTVRLERHRTATPRGFHDRLSLISVAALPMETIVELTLAADGAAMAAVRSGAATPATTAGMRSGSGIRWNFPEATVEASVSEGPAPDIHIHGATSTLSWSVTLLSGETWTVELTVATHMTAGELFSAPAGHTALPWSEPTITAADPRLGLLVTRSLDDAASLLLVDPQHPSDRVLAAGAPWYLTLFGRDALWSARMLLPLGTELALSTLRVLARRQGTIDDPASEQQPGKILHEVRHNATDCSDNLTLPATYYGTIDATPLWICLLVDAWRWGAPTDQILDLFPALDAALHWLRRAIADGDGLLRYRDHRGDGLVHQGWKDSPDAIRHHDGSYGKPPIALCEVHGYAYEAAIGAAAMLDAFGRPGGAQWRARAERLQNRFRAEFWVEDPDGRYPAVALDGDGRAVNTVSSNLGHLLGTGLLTAPESALVAARLTGKDLDSGFGVRTLSASATAYNPLGYHLGGVWPHDTAIVAVGLSRAGYPAAAASYLEGLLAAATGFDYQLPELYSGYARDGASDKPVSHPAACRPQAWASAASVHLLTALLGLTPDAPGGRLCLDPAMAVAVGSLSVTGLTYAGAPLSVSVTAAGHVSVDAAPGTTVVIRGKVSRPSVSARRTHGDDG